MRESSAEVERLAEGTERLTAWVLGLADTGIQFAVFTLETSWALANESVFSENTLTTVETWLRSTIVLSLVEFVFAFTSFEVVNEIFGAEVFCAFAVINADDVSFTFAEKDSCAWEFTNAHDIEFAQWIGGSFWSVEGSFE